MDFENFLTKWRWVFAIIPSTQLLCIVRFIGLSAIIVLVSTHGEDQVIWLINRFQMALKENSSIVEADPNPTACPEFNFLPPSSQDIFAYFTFSAQLKLLYDKKIESK